LQKWTIREIRPGRLRRLRFEIAFSPSSDCDRFVPSSASGNGGADGSLVNAMKAGHHFLLDEISLANNSVLERLNSECSRTPSYSVTGRKRPYEFSSGGCRWFSIPGYDKSRR
jgi:AAA domain (dynein-related subfamily)